MKGSVLSRWSRYARALPPTTLVLGALVVLPSCAGKAGQTATTPAPKDAPAAAKPTETASAKPKPTETAAQPAAQPQPAEPAAPTVIDSTAVAAEFCKKITTGVQAAIKKDSSLANLDEAVQKITASVPDETADVALAKNATCHQP